MALELPGQPPVGRIGFRHHQQAGGLLVETVDDPGAQDAADPREVPAVVEKGVDQRPARMAGGRMDDHPRRLVDDQQRCVLVENLQGDRLGQDPGGLRRGDDNGDAVARPSPSGPALAGRSFTRTRPSATARWIWARERSGSFAGKEEVQAERPPLPARP